MTTDQQIIGNCTLSMETPINDFFDSPLVLPSTTTGSIDPFSNVAYGIEENEPIGSTWVGSATDPQFFQLVGHTAWFEWTCPTTGNYEFDLSVVAFVPGFEDVAVAIWTGSTITGLTEIVSAEEAAPTLFPSCTAGTVYRIQIGCYSDDLFDTSNYTGVVSMTWAPL